VKPDVVINRKFFNNLDVTMPDGVKVNVWGFFDPNKEPFFPNETMRVRQNQVVWTHLKTAFYGHTIHHHGIEPTAFNDGVPDTSFIVLPEYTYQWRPTRVGTYFYHCHVIATVHVEMGMYGFLIVDPEKGPGFVQRANDLIPYQVEALWAFDDIDPRWHENFTHDVGRACPFEIRSDAAFHHFDPKYFLITGVPAPLTETDPRVVVAAEKGSTIVLRTLGASYAIARLTLPLDAEIIGIDGRAQGEDGFAGYSSPIPLKAGTPLELTTAQRYEMLVQAKEKGNFPVTVEYLHWITRKPLGVARTSINII
jgi:FtsP/CotA-like multicopper oxidase with cupredoxin domain